MREAGKNRGKGSNQEEMFAGTSLLPGLPLRLAHSQPTTLRSQLLTLLFLEAVGLRRTWDATRATWAMLWRYSPVVLAPTGIATLSDSWRSWLKWGQMTC